MKLATFLDDGRRRIACALACFALFLGFQLFATVPQLHSRLHSDAADSNHHCALTLLTQGQLNTTANEGIVKIFVAELIPTLLPAGEKLVLSDYRQLPPGRAPPLA